MESKEVLDKTKKQLKQIYDSANPAELKREIDKMTWQLYKIHQDKQNKQNRIKNLQRSNQKA
jgi:FtsZ-binding cell division protein ZapB